MNGNTRNDVTEAKELVAEIRADQDFLPDEKEIAALCDWVDRLVAALEERERALQNALDAFNEVAGKADAFEERVATLEAALQEIAGSSPRSHRPEVEQLRDAVKWRQGIARDVLSTGGVPV